MDLLAYLDATQWYGTMLMSDDSYEKLTVDTIAKYDFRNAGVDLIASAPGGTREISCPLLVT